MKIIVVVPLLFLTSCATSSHKMSPCQEQVAALAKAEIAAQKKSDETMAASDKAPESSDLAMAAAQAAMELAAASTKLSDAKASCVGNSKRLELRPNSSFKPRPLRGLVQVLASFTCPRPQSGPA
jgi:hypothetical protein